MKTNLLTTLVLSLFIYAAQAQNGNALPTEGNVGVGTLTPSKPLEVVGSTDLHGRLSVDSCLLVKDTATFESNVILRNQMRAEEDAEFEKDLKVNGDLYILGESTFFDKASFQGNLTLPGLTTIPALSTEMLMFVDEDGFVKKTSLDELQKSMYVSKLCPNDGSPILNPTWQNGENKIFSPCPEVNVGIGTSTPSRKLEVIGIAKAISLELGNPSASSALINGFRQTNQYDRLLRLGTNPPNGSEKLVMELFTNGELTLYHDGLGSPFTVFDENQFKLLQLEGTGLLRARKIRIDLETWADYVFEPHYQLMPLNELKTYVAAEKHLPGVPTAAEVEEEGIDLGEMNQVLLEKIEELTLYVIELNEEVEKLKAAAKQ